MPEQKDSLITIHVTPKVLNNLLRVVLNSKEVTIQEGLELLRVLKPQK